MPEPFLLKIPQRALHLAGLLTDHVRAEGSFRPIAISILAQALGQVEDDRDRQDVVLPGERDERLARLSLHVGRIHHRELSAREPPAGDEVQGRESVIGRRLVVLVIGDQAAAIVRRQHFRGLEVLPSKRRLAAA